MIRSVLAALGAAVLLVVVPSAAGRSATPVDLVLVLALDVSNSVDQAEFDLQGGGLADAFRHSSIIAAISQGRYGRIAVTAIQWAGEGEQTVAVPWMMVSGTSSAIRFADQIEQMERAFAGGQTHISGAIELAQRLVQAAPFIAQRSVVDVSGDGTNNVGNSPHGARDRAVLAGMTINGLAITNDVARLASYYRYSVIGGQDSFVMTANDYDDYARAILAKLLREITPRRIS